MKKQKKDVEKLDINYEINNAQVDEETHERLEQLNRDKDMSNFNVQEYFINLLKDKSDEDLKHSGLSINTINKLRQGNLDFDNEMASEIAKITGISKWLWKEYGKMVNQK